MDYYQSPKPSPSALVGEKTSYIYHGETTWIPQANARIDTYKSGLVKITQDYICMKETANFNKFKEGDLYEERISLPVANAYIFPAPSYQDLGNGFIRCSVTAYTTTGFGWRTELIRRLGDYPETLIYAENATLKAVYTTSQKMFDVAIYTCVAPAGTIPSPPNEPKLKIYTTGMIELEEGGTEAFYRELFRRVERYDITSYGTYNEIIVSVSADGRSTTDTTRI